MTPPLLAPVTLVIDEGTPVTDAILLALNLILCAVRLDEAVASSTHAVRDVVFHDVWLFFWEISPTDVVIAP